MKEATDRVAPDSAVSTQSMPGWPKYDEDERAAVDAVLRSGKVNYWTGGECREFECEYAAHAGTKYAIALSNGTVALELALAALGIGPGDEVVTTPRTFIASASCVVMRGARVVFADVDPCSQNITAESVERVLTPRTKAIIAVHLAGWPCEMDEILALAHSRGIAVIEDCAQANGAAYRGRQVGGIGDFGAFSFCQDKIITTGGEGGMLTTNDTERWSWAWSYKDHGKSYDAVHKRRHPPGFRWLHESFGTNWRMTEMQAAIGRLQLGKLPLWNARRAANAKILIDALSNLHCLRIPEPPPRITHAWYKFYVFIEPSALRSGWTRDRIMSEVVARGVPCFSGTCSEIYLEKAFDAEGGSMRPVSRLPVARMLGETSLLLLVHPTLTEDHMAYAVQALRDVLRSAVR